MNKELSAELAEICGIHAGDGYLRNKNYKRELDISGNVEERNYYDNHVIPLFEKVFKISITGKYFPHRNTYGFVIRDKKVIEFMHKIGFPYGNKSLIVKIPKFILNNSKFIKFFLRGYFDTDGCLSFAKKYGKYSLFKRTRHFYPTISFCSVSKKIIDNLKEIFKKMKFNFVYYTYQSKKPNEHLRYNCQINGVSNMKRWLNLIGTKNPSKYSRFLVWQKYGFCPSKTTYTQRLKTLKGIIDPNKFYGPVV